MVSQLQNGYSKLKQVFKTGAHIGSGSQAFAWGSKKFYTYIYKIIVYHIILSFWALLKILTLKLHQ